jgi:hypothetical protein
MFHRICCETESSHQTLVNHLEESKARFFFMVYDAPGKHSIVHSSVLPSTNILGVNIE